MRRPAPPSRGRPAESRGKVRRGRRRPAGGMTNDWKYFAVSCLCPICRLAAVAMVVPRPPAGQGVHCPRSITRARLIARRLGVAAGVRFDALHVVIGEPEMMADL